MATKTESNIYKKIFNLQSEIGAISKSAKNKFFDSRYFDINSLIKQLHPLLVKYELVLLQPCIDGAVKSIISDMDGNSIESSLQLPTGLDAQKIGSAITYYRRYTLTSLLSLQAEDDDGNKASNKVNVQAVDLTTPKQPLTKETVEKMKSAMTEGKEDKVRSALKKYEFTKEQLTEIGL
jgi:hypothetical protein